MSKKDGKHNNSGDSALFRDAVGDAQPIAARERHHAPRKRPKPRATSRLHDERQALEESLQPPPDRADVETGEELSFRRTSVQLKTLRQLRRGKYAVQASLDLHGLTSPEAKPELRGFIDDCTRRGYRCVRVVHGKGLGSGPRGPVLKHRVNNWLRNWDDVMAFATAPDHDGGTGAIYVLLKRRR